VVSVVILAAVTIGGYAYYNDFMARIYEPVPVPPEGDSRQTVLCLGDSLTHGNVSANYVDLLNRRLDSESVRLVNGGINGNMVHDVAARLDALLAETGNPDVVILLIGTNDANATLDSTVAERALAHPDLGRVPDEAYYRSALEELVRRISGSTGAIVILVSIPPIGENPGSPEWTRSLEFAEAGREVADATESRYVPFAEELSARIMSDPPPSDDLPSHSNWYRGMVEALIRRHFFDSDFNSIGSRNGYRYHSDQLHLNEEGALVLADLLEPEIRQTLGDS
jgi:lysophospholipase L1-like esterase